MLNLFTIHKTPFMFKIQSSLNEHGYKYKYKLSEILLQC